MIGPSSLSPCSPSESELCVGLFWRRRWAGRSPGVDLGRGGGSMPSTDKKCFGLRVMSRECESLLSIDPEWRRRRAGTVVPSIFAVFFLLTGLGCRCGLRGVVSGKRRDGSDSNGRMTFYVLLKNL